jgi:pSer/pThr/pTyr-binding forkhead associated (FHA) protein
MSGEFVLRGADGRTHPVVGAVLIGTAGDCQIVLEDHLVSHHHARLWIDQGRLLVQDSGSVNGTYVNQQRISQTVSLRPGDQLQIGRTVFTVATATRPAGAQPKASRSGKPWSRLWLFGCLGLAGLVGIAGLCIGAWLLMGARARQQVRNQAYLSVALNLEEPGGLLLYTGIPSEDPMTLPSGTYYLESLGQDGKIYQELVSVPPGEAQTQVHPGEQGQGGVLDHEVSRQLQELAQFGLGVDHTRLEFMQVLSGGFKAPLGSPTTPMEIGDLDSIYFNYEALVGMQTVVIQNLDAMQARGESFRQVGRVGETEFRGVHSKVDGMPAPVFGSILSFFGFLGDAGQRAAEDIDKISSAMNDQQKEEAFSMVPEQLLHGAQSYDQMLDKLKNGELNNQAAQIRRALYTSPDFYEAAQDVKKNGRPELQTAYEEGSEFVKKGAELQVEIVKHVLGEVFPDISTGFDYADKANEWAEFIKSSYTDPLGTAKDWTVGQIKDKVKERIQSDLQNLFPEADEDQLEELAGQLTDQMSAQVGEIVKAANPVQPGAQPPAQAQAQAVATRTSPPPSPSPTLLRPSPTSEPSPTTEPTETSEPTPTEQPTLAPTATLVAGTEWIDQIVDDIASQLLGEGYDPIAIALGVEDLRDCLIQAAASGKSQEEAMATCANQIAGSFGPDGDWAIENASISSDGGCQGLEFDAWTSDPFLMGFAQYGIFEETSRTTDEIVLTWKMTQSSEDLNGAALNASVVINPQNVLISYDMVIPPSQSSLPGVKTAAMSTRPEKRMAWLGWGMLAAVLPIGLVGLTSVYGPMSRKRRIRQGILFGLLLLALVGLSGCFDMYGSIRASYSFPTSPSVQAYLMDPSAALPVWRFPDGGGTIVLDLTVISEDEQGNQIQESCRVNMAVTGVAAVYPDSVLASPEN